MLGQQELLTNAYGLIAVGFTLRYRYIKLVDSIFSPFSFPLPLPPSFSPPLPLPSSPLLSSRERLQVQSPCYAVLLVKHWVECLR